MIMKIYHKLAIILILVSFYSCRNTPKEYIELQDVYPWCIVAYDSLERTPSERIAMMHELGLEKYAYDWRDRHLDSTLSELKQVRENNIEIISVWLWLNAKRDSLGHLSPANNRIFEMIRTLKDSGFDGPWGILGHVENADAKEILEQNIRGLKTMGNN